jgi:hypothetical protein
MGDAQPSGWMQPRSAVCFAGGLSVLPQGYLWGLESQESGLVVIPTTLN